MESNSNKQISNDLLSDFCKQYTANNNNISTLLISTITSLGIAFVGYGYALAKYPQLVFIAAIGVFIVTCFLSSLSSSFGYCRRRDQHTAYRIMQDISSELSNCDDELPPSLVKYYSSGEKKCWFCFLPDFYNIVYIALQLILVTITIYSSYTMGNCFWNKFILITSGITILIINIIVRTCYYCKYSSL